jgi:hypothetical protein
MALTSARVLALHLALSFAGILCALPGAARAQDADAAPPTSASLADPHEPYTRADSLRLAEPGQLELARHSLAGPRAEVITGAVVLVATPILAGVAAQAAGPGWFECGFLDDEEDPECEARVARQQEHAARVGIGVGLTFGLLGAGLVTHGAYRIRQIKVARREVSLAGASLELDRGYAGLTFRASF